ncbi:MAG: DUF3990 domain-containing protein [Fibromonadales bacterium]|nr:DUF3990 domain-containing protein [Fibromonadales bacterium]
MILYHGSNCEFDVISLQKSKNNRDFGRGFYTTTLEEQAREWAEILFLRTQKGFPMLYEFELQNFESLNVKSFSEYNLEWLNFVKENRMSGGIQHSYDIVRGPVANDRTREAIAQYMSGAYDAEYTIKILIHMKSNDQISFHTEKSLAKLKFMRVTRWNV